MQQRDRITDVARGKWASILPAVGVAATFLTGKHGPCPFCGGKDRFRFTDKDGCGRWICSQCGSGDGMDAVMRVNHCDFVEAAKLVRDQAGSAVVTERKEANDETKRRNLRSLWKASVPVVSGDPVSRYLSGRLGQIAIPPSIRYCDRCRYYGEEVSWHPAMVAMIQDIDGRPVLLHKTYLTADGHKASLEKERMLMPGTFPPGAAVRLSEAGHTIGIAEGIETAFSASILFHIPVWAALNAGSMEKWVSPEQAKEVVVFGDNDANFVGQRAAFALGHRLGREGLAVSVKIPDVEGQDWNDVLSLILKERSAA